MITESSQLGPVSQVSTNWTLVEGSSQVGPYLNRLVEHYRPWIEKQARMSWSGRVNAEDVQEALQIFLLRMLEGRVVKRADRTRGSFRGFLRTCLDNCVRTEIRRRYRNQDKIRPLEMLEQSIADECPKFLDTACALEILFSAGSIVFQRCQLQNRDDLYQLIKRQIIQPIFEAKPRLSQDELMAEFGFPTRGVVSGKMKTASKWFSAAIDQAIDEYAQPQEREKERADLFQALPQLMQLLQAQADAIGHLYSQIEADVQCFDSIRWSRRCGDASIDTYMDLFTHPAPPVDQLQLVKELGKSLLVTDQKSCSKTSRLRSDIPPAAAHLLYHVPISVARTRLDRNISKMPNQKLIGGLTRCLYRIHDNEPEVVSLITQQIELLQACV